MKIRNLIKENILEKLTKENTIENTIEDLKKGKIRGEKPSLRRFESELDSFVYDGSVLSGPLVGLPLGLTIGSLISKYFGCPPEITEHYLFCGALVGWFGAPISISLGLYFGVQKPLLKEYQNYIREHNLE